MRHAIATLVLLGLTAAPPAPVASMTCPPVTEPGRVRCEVEVRATGAALRTGDVVVTRVPDFAVALRGRVGPLDASAKDDAVWRWAIAFAAKSRGTGAVAARVRVVACAAPDACVPSEIDVTAPFVVGP